MVLGAGTESHKPSTLVIAVGTAAKANGIHEHLESSATGAATRANFRGARDKELPAHQTFSLARKHRLHKANSVAKTAQVSNVVALGLNVGNYLRIGTGEVGGSGGAIAQPHAKHVGGNEEVAGRKVERRRQGDTVVQSLVLGIAIQRACELFSGADVRKCSLLTRTASTRPRGLCGLA